MLLVLAGVVMVAGCAFDGAKRWYYLVYVLPFLVSTTAIAIKWLWDERPIPHAATGAAVAALVAIQVGGTVYRIHKNDYRNVFLPAARFAIAQDPGHELIIGGGELGFVNGFPDYLVDDVSLGYATGERARVLFVPELYWGLWMGNMHERAPAVDRFITRTLKNDYVLSFQNPGYRVYERKTGL